MDIRLIGSRFGAFYKGVLVAFGRSYTEAIVNGTMALMRTNRAS